MQTCPVKVPDEISAFIKCIAPAIMSSSRISSRCRLKYLHLLQIFCTASVFLCHSPTPTQRERHSTHTRCRADKGGQNEGAPAFVAVTLTLLHMYSIYSFDTHAHTHTHTCTRVERGAHAETPEMTLCPEGGRQCRTAERLPVLSLVLCVSATRSVPLCSCQLKVPLNT